MKLAPGIWYLKGGTAYELQIWRFVLRIIHLQGAYWRDKPWRRFSIGYYPED